MKISKLGDILKYMYESYKINTTEQPKSYSGIEISEFWDKMRDDEFFNPKASENIDMYKYICNKYNIKDPYFKKEEVVERERSIF